MSTTSHEYGKSSIRTVVNLNHIRLRPTAYFGSVDKAGQLHAIKEIIDNSIDELELTSNGKLDVVLFKDKKNKTYQILITDTGRGIPVDSLVDCYTVLHTSGKYDTNSYKFSGGLLGIGAKAAAGASSRMKTMTMRANRIGILDIKESEVTKFTIEESNSYAKTGLYTIFELDKTLFQEILEFSESGSEMIAEILKKLNLFIEDTSLVVRECDTPIDTRIWENTLSSKDILEILDSSSSKASIIFDSSQITNIDRMDYLKNLWKIDSPIGWVLDDLDHPADTGNLGYKIKIYLPKKIKNTGSTLSMVNHVLMKDQTSSHILGLYDCIKSRLVNYIEDKELKKFFNDNYKLPMFFAIYIKYSGAQFSGTTKDGFKDLIFLRLYKDMLNNDLKQYSEELWEQLYTNISSDLENKYNLFYNKSIKIKQVKLNIFDLNNPAKFHDCRSRENAELFIVEGDSANSIIGVRDANFQATYATKGKPINAVIGSNDRKTSIQRLRNNEEYSDLITISGIHPEQEDLSTANFKRLNINNDADEDGIHIRAIHIGNFYVYNPNIIRSGMLHIIKPPLFTLHYGNKGKMYLQNKVAYIDALIHLVYAETLDIRIKTRENTPPKSLNKDTFRELCFIVHKVGELIHEYVDKMAIQTEHGSVSKDVAALILEKLIFVSGYLIPGEVNIPAVKAVFGGTTLTYDRDTNIIVIGVGNVDLPISLNDFNEIIYTEILPILNSIQWKKYAFSVTTKHSDLHKNTTMSIVGLYNIFLSLGNMFKVERYKGLGELSSEDLEKSCVNPETRSSSHIVSEGDAEQIIAMLGEDIETRRDLLNDINNLLS